MRQKRLYTCPDTLSCCTSRIPSVLVMGYFINGFIKFEAYYRLFISFFVASKHTLTQNKKMDRVRFNLSLRERQEIFNTVTPEYVDFFSASIYSLY